MVFKSIPLASDMTSSAIPNLIKLRVDSNLASSMPSLLPSKNDILTASSNPVTPGSNHNLQL